MENSNRNRRLLSVVSQDNCGRDLLAIKRPHRHSNPQSTDALSTRKFEVLGSGISARCLTNAPTGGTDRKLNWNRMMPQASLRNDGSLMEGDVLSPSTGYKESAVRPRKGSCLECHHCAFSSSRILHLSAIHLLDAGHKARFAGRLRSVQRT